MPPASMDLNFYVDQGILLLNRKGVNQLGELKIAQLNEFPISIWLLKEGPDASTPVIVSALAAPWSRIVISARPNDKLTDPDPLFLLGSFDATGSGDALHYEGVLNTNTAPIQALFAGAPGRGTYPCLLDLDFMVSANPEDGRETALKQQPFNLYKTMYQGTEGVPPPGAPSYPLPDALITERNLASGNVVEGDDFVDIDIAWAGLSAPPAVATPLGLQKPNVDAENLFILSACAVNAETIRVFLSSPAPEAGYQATVLFR